MEKAHRTYEGKFHANAIAHLESIKRVMEDKRQNKARGQQELQAERIVVPIVSALELEINEINCSTGSRDEQDLHETVV